MSAVNRLTVPELLGLNAFDVDEDEAHIVLDPVRCASCPAHPCVSACPAHLYTLGPDGQVTFDYAGCLECGTCRVLCVVGGVARWTYPRGTFGVAYRRG